MDIDNVGLDRLDLVKGQSDPGHGVFADIVNEDVALLDQLRNRGLAFVRFKVPDNRALAAIDGEVTRPHAARVHGFSDVSEIVSGRWFDLHDFGAHIGQCLGTIGTENDRRHVCNANVGKDVCTGHDRLRFICINGCPPGDYVR